MDLPSYAPFALLAFLIGYLLGSIPFGLILTRLAGLGDIRAIGSGNIGATNVLRTGNKALAATTLVLDALKATAAVLLARHFGATYWGIAELAALLAGFGAFLGHLFPVWLGFRGGKGVATYIGALLGWAWPAALVFMGVWLAVAFLTRYSSLAALVASIVTPACLVFGYQNTGLAIAAAVMSVLLIAKHRTNIARLLEGSEPKIGSSSAAKA
jgi:glycerol-3-phosphate acyltransferase PlsY